MRRLLLLVAILALPTSVWANPALVAGQHTFCTAPGVTSLTCSFAGAVTAGNIVIVGCSAGNSVAFTFSDTTDGSYTTDTQNVASSLSVGLGHKENHSGSSPTITCATGSTSAIQMFIAEFSGVVTASPLDGTPTNNLTLGSTTPTSGSVTTSFANSLVIGYFDVNNSATTITPGGGYTIIDKDESGAVVGGGWEYAVVAAGANNPTVTLNNISNVWGATAAFKASAGGGGGGGCKGLTLGVWSCF